MADKAASDHLSVNDLRGFKQLRRVAKLLGHLHQAGSWDADIC